MLCSVRICKHEGKQKYLYKMRRRAGSAPAPSPAPLPEPWGEGGGVAGLFGGSIWRVKWAHLFKRFESKKTCCWANWNGKEWNVLWWICRLRYHYVVSIIVLFALLQVHRNQQIVVLVPWLCGSVNLTANENIHHEEERTAFYCCSARFCWSRHQPGYVQEGQEVGRGYLLLGIHVRRIPSDIMAIFCGQIFWPKKFYESPN